MTTKESGAAIPVARLNHAVLYVRDLDRSVDFYSRAFGFQEIGREGGMMAFLRAAGSDNHHDLGLMAVGADAGAASRRNVGLYHLAWEVPTIEDLAAAAAVLAEFDALTGMSDHGATKSLYGKDPDGIEFEVMWTVPREQWGAYESRGVVLPLDMQKELSRFGAARVEGTTSRGSIRGGADGTRGAGVQRRGGAGGHGPADRGGGARYCQRQQ